MTLKPRLMLFTIAVISVVVVSLSVMTILSLRDILSSEMRENQHILYSNFEESCQNALYVADDLGIKAYSESLEDAAEGVAFAVFVDQSRRDIKLGGVESLHRFDRVKPTCDMNPGLMKTPFVQEKIEDDILWRTYCAPLRVATARGTRISGTVFLGFNMDTLNYKLNSVVNEVRYKLIQLALLVFLLGLLFSYMLAGRLVRPILRLKEGAKAIGDGKLDTKIPITSADELGFLAQEFNLMAEKLKELDRLKDDFVSSVSHELRSPLAAISGYVELLQVKPLEEISREKREKALGIIDESTRRLSRFISDILDLAKLKAGQLVVVKKPMDIRHMAEDVFRLYATLFDKKKIQAVVDVPSSVPLVQADDDKIRQVVTNLISNALKFTPPGGKIRLGAKNQVEFVQITVEDTGLGIPEDETEIVFERFRQAGTIPLHPGDPKGTGLGLAIAKGIVDGHGGRIWIESAVGKGTKVHFTIPVRGDEA